MTFIEKKKKLWIGGSSGLARTYMNAYGGDDWILLGHETCSPHWIPPEAQYYSCNLLDCKPASIPLLERLKNVEQVVISIRPPLFSSFTNAEMNAYCEQLVRGLQVFLQALLHRNDNNIYNMLHISSVAAANHLQAQYNVGVNDDDTMIASTDLSAPYDRFKRACEEIVDRFNDANVNTTCTNLRLSAIFSDDPGCIQCQALQIQCRVGSYLPQCIDCNSSRNVAAAIQLMLQQDKKLSRYYYYTRPARQYPQPVAYGEYLGQYRQAFDIKWFVSIPAWMVRYLVEIVHWLSLRLQLRIPFLESIDYLLQVSYRDHCFDNSAFVAGFSEIVNQEETIQECFRRRQKVLSP